jgi:hypothetical protein
MFNLKELDVVASGQQPIGEGGALRKGARVALSGGLLLANSVALATAPPVDGKGSADPKTGPTAEALAQAVAILERSGVAAATRKAAQQDAQVYAWNNWSNWQNY